MGITKKDWVIFIAGALLTAIGWLTVGKAVGVAVIMLCIVALVGIHCLEGKSKGEIFLFVIAAILLTPSMIFSITGSPLLSIFSSPPSPKQQIADTVQKDLKDWISQSGYGTTDVLTPDDDADFQINFPVDNHIIAIKRFKANQGRLLLVWTNTSLNDEQIKAMGRMSPNRRQTLEEDMKIQISKANLDYWPTQPLVHQWAIKKTVRIQQGMEGEFLETTQRLNREALALEQTVSRALNTTEVARER